MFVIFIYLIITLLVVSILTLACFVISAKSKYQQEKSSVFECGFDLLSALRLPFSLNFFFITIIFLIFDVELVLILPFVFNMEFLSSSSTSFLLVMFFMVLVLGFMYEWLTGLLNWMI